MIRPEFNADTIAQKSDIIDRIPAVALFMPTTDVIIPPVPAWVGITTTHTSARYTRIV